ncbi:hypothetical protein [Acidisphaera sp. L21]|uniref:hypothetical protein n=1 Tax=Acidisphaera sp. L21 TaxID=1641851 RepID=UPI00131C0EF1|nr:hypothetical protein [Acidisphaera sp. L21]
MAYETIIVAYDSGKRANNAVRALREMGVPASDIRRHPVDQSSLEDVAAAPAEQSGLWTWLFGEEAEGARLATYKKAVQRGGTVLSVRVMEDEAGQVQTVLNSFEPLDLSGGDLSAQPEVP